MPTAPGACPHCATYHEMANSISAQHDRSHGAYALLAVNLIDLAAQLKNSVEAGAPVDVAAVSKMIEKLLESARGRLAQPLFNVRSTSKSRPALPTNEEIADQFGDLVKRVTAMHAEAIAYAELARSVESGQLQLPASTEAIS